MSTQTDGRVLDVAIIGAGPVGLFLAGELAAHGIHPTVFEQATVPELIPKANGVVGQAAVELHQRGLLDGTSLRLLSPPRFPFGPITLELDRLAENPLHILPIPQRQLEELLERRAVELGGTLVRGHRLVALDQEPDLVRLHMGSEGGQERMQTRYLVGCDGAHSTVRKQLGVSFPGFTSDTISRIGRVTIPADRVRRVGDRIEIDGAGAFVLFNQNRTSRGTLAIAPAAALDPSAPNDLYLISTQEPRGKADASDTPDESELRASVRRVVAAEIPFIAAHWVRSSVPNSRQVTHYQLARVFLAGDAAHVFNAGGAALNVGLLDAATLAAPLADVIRGTAPPSALENYQRLRHPAGERALRHTRAQAALSNHDPNIESLTALLAEQLREPVLLRSIAETLENG
jgi:2-polyprenyl-6-methoxyphenol hydroxylase-like FAD-dependent oxidoreductase